MKLGLGDHVAKCHQPSRHTSPRTYTLPLTGPMSAIGCIVAVPCVSRVEPRRALAGGTSRFTAHTLGRSPETSRCHASTSGDVTVVDESHDSVVTRRGIVGASLAALTLNTMFAQIAFAEDDDEDEEAAQEAIEASMQSVLSQQSGEQSYPRQVAFGERNVMQASFEVSSLWSMYGKDVAMASDPVKASNASWDKIVDPVNGKVVQNVRVFSTPNYATKSITDLGKPENVSVAKALGLESDDSYRRADMLGAAKRTAPDGQIYYDWEMVASPPPKQCPSAVGCLYPDHIYLMSATVRNGDLYVLSVDAFPENWRQAGNSLRRLRGSFEVRPENIAEKAEQVLEVSE